MARCSALSALAAPGLPSKAANGLETGFGVCGVGVACARAPSAALGIAGVAAELAARGTIDPVMSGWVPIAGRGFGSGTLCAKVGAAVRQASSAAIATVWVRAVWCAAITVSA